MVQDQILFERAAFTNQDGVLGKPIQSGRILSPGAPARIEGNDLLWTIDYKKCRQIVPPADLLDKFVALWDGTDEKIADFASRFGPLRLGEDGSLSYKWQHDGSGRRPASMCFGREPLCMWRFLSRRANAILRLAAAHQSGEKFSEDDLSVLFTKPSNRGDHYGENSYPQVFGFAPWARRTWEIVNGELVHGKSIRPESVLSTEVSSWIGRFGPKLQLGGEDHRSWQLTVHFDGRVLAYVSLQLALLLAQADQLFVCSGCGYPYARKRDIRRPNKGHMNYCSNCGDSVALKRADQARRERMSRARELATEGFSAEEIAQQIGSKTSAIQRWIGRR